MYHIFIKIKKKNKKRNKVAKKYPFYTIILNFRNVKMNFKVYEAGKLNNLKKLKKMTLIL